MKKNSKNIIIQLRCTEKEEKIISKSASKKGMKRSEYIRSKLFCEQMSIQQKALFMDEIQELLNYLEEKNIADEKVKRMVDGLWKKL